MRLYVEWNVVVKWDLKVFGCDFVGQNQATQIRVHRRTPVDTVMNLMSDADVGEFLLTSKVIVSQSITSLCDV
jgi:hypothetical protein